MELKPSSATVDAASWHVKRHITQIRVMTKKHRKATKYRMRRIFSFFKNGVETEFICSQYRIIARKTPYHTNSSRDEKASHGH
jgi:hypothetical protein